MLWTKDHYELLEQFERANKACRLDKEAKELWPRGIVYQDGRVNQLFLAYRDGCAYGRAIERLASEVPMQEILVLQQIREAIGDPHGKLMQDEVVEVVRKCINDRDAFRRELSAVMPADFKDWHENDPAEWPMLAAQVIRALRAERDDLADSNAALLKAARRAILPLAHAARENSLYEPEYQELSSAIEAAGAPS